VCDELRVTLGLVMLFITHDLGVVASIADRVLVLERGEICDDGPVATLLTLPGHEYARRLVSVAPEAGVVA
jgi:peptide/nickel transport system ATP-binding protein